MGTQISMTLRNSSENKKDIARMIKNEFFRYPKWCEILKLSASRETYTLILLSPSILSALESNALERLKSSFCTALSSEFPVDAALSCEFPVDAAPSTPADWLWNLDESSETCPVARDLDLEFRMTRPKTKVVTKREDPMADPMTNSGVSSSPANAVKKSGAPFAKATIYYTMWSVHFKFILSFLPRKVTPATAGFNFKYWLMFPIAREKCRSE